MDDPYEILGVSRDASLDEITRAYKRARFLAHPDKGGTHEGFVRIQAAYEKIMEPPPFIPPTRGRGAETDPPDPPPDYEPKAHWVPGVGYYITTGGLCVTCGAMIAAGRKARWGPPAFCTLCGLGTIPWFAYQVNKPKEEQPASQRKVKTPRTRKRTRKSKKKSKRRVKK